MESVMADAGDSLDNQQVENEGPLAGLRSVLPVQTGMADTHLSKPYALKILANENQLEQAALLDKQLNSESTPRTAPERPKTLSIRPLRWIIAAVLLVAVLLPMILKTSIFPVPSISTSASPAGAFFTAVEGLGVSQPVLVVVDYQPGFAGELELAAVPVFRQLEKNKVPLAFISTSPVGPFMAERLQKRADPEYQQNYEYINLGYLPGGAGGIRAFAEQPSVTVGHDLSLGDMWATAPFSNIAGLADFGAIIVLTDNPDTGRLWVEQAGQIFNPKNSSTPRPFLMVVSAQAEPMLRPYTISGQVTGLLAGLEGAAQYENKLGTADKQEFHATWDAFGAAMLVAELLILFGGAWAIFTGLRTRRTAKEQDEA
jgi:hypothetical protein